MKKKGIFRCIAFCFTIFSLMVPEYSAADDYAVIDTGIPYDTTQRFGWYPWIEYNSVDDEFLAVWHTSGVLREDCLPGDEYECGGPDAPGPDGWSFHGISALRISPADGSPKGSIIEISPVEGPNDSVSFKSMPHLAYNADDNQWGVSYSLTPNPYNTATGGIQIVTVTGADGTILNEVIVWQPSLYNANHPNIAYGTAMQEYTSMINDKYVFRPDNEMDNISYRLDANGNIVGGPNRIGVSPGTAFSTHIEYNPTDDTFLSAWEDWRYSPFPGAPWFFRSPEIYAALTDSLGNHIVADIPICDDHDTENGRQLHPAICHNPDRNEFLVAWTDSTCDGYGVKGILVNADGTIKGDSFIIADTVGSQMSPSIAYVPRKQRYFVAWHDARNEATGYDIYAGWLKPKGERAGDDIPIYIADGDQTHPEIAYSPVADSFVFVWRDRNADGDFEPSGPGAAMAPEVKADIRGAIYGRVHGTGE